MALTPDQLKRTLQEASRPLGVKELLRLAGLNPGQQTDLKRALRDLLRDGQIEKEGKRFFLKGARRPPPAPHAAAPRSAKGAPAAHASRSAAGKGAGAAHTSRGSAGKGAHAGNREHAQGHAPRRDRFARATAGELRLVTGKLSVHRDGFGFVRPETGEGEDVFLPAHEARRALDNDRVQVEVVATGAGRSEGRLIEVVERRREFVIGTYHEEGPRTAWVMAKDSSLPDRIKVPATQLARDGDIVKVRLGVGESLTQGAGTRGLSGEVAGSLGRPGDPSQEVLSITYGEGFSPEFPGEVMDEADRIGLTVTAAEAKGEGRKDLRSIALVTIDGADARDFDDAVYAEDLPGGGFALWVAIADVTHYVREGTALDTEAYRRATSVYLPDRVLPMLPERLSNGICSLKPDEDRLCMVAQMRFDATGALEESEVYPGVMKSQARCTYDEVQDVLDGNDLPHRNAFKPHFERLLKLSRMLRAMRKERGAIDFDLPESRIVMGEDGMPARMDQRERKESHRLIEECMLAANEAVAKFFLDRELPSVYRFHGEPNVEKLQTFAALAQAYGFTIDARKELTSKELNGFVSQLEGHPEQRALNQLLLRSMMQAVYSSENVGHYGLASDHYLHFTSPIRRYPDLLVHRLLKEHWKKKGKKPSAGESEMQTEKLEQMAMHCSDRERAAMQVEREVSGYYAALLMKDRVGEEFEAVVSSVTDFGFFVELTEEHIEGLVKGELLGSDFTLDVRIYALTYPNGRKVRVGQKLRVKLVGVNLDRRQIDFDVVQFEGEERRREGREVTREARPARAGSRASAHAPARTAARSHAAEKAPALKRAAPTEVVRPPPLREIEHVAPAADVGGSAHPGFDRLRALASRAKPGREPEPAGAFRGGAPSSHGHAKKSVTGKRGSSAPKGRGKR